MVVLRSQTTSLVSGPAQGDHSGRKEITEGIESVSPDMVLRVMENFEKTAPKVFRPSKTPFFTTLYTHLRNKMLFVIPETICFQ